MDYPHRKSQTIPSFLLKDQVERLKGLSRSLNCAEDSSSENETTSRRSYRRLPRVIPLTIEPHILETELPNAQLNQHIYMKGRDSPSNVIIVSGEKLQPVNWKRTKNRRRRDRSLPLSRTNRMDVDYRDRASSPIRTMERDAVSLTITSAKGTDNDFQKDRSEATGMSSNTAVSNQIRKLSVERVKEGRIGVESRPFKSLGSEHLNTSDEDHQALITRSSTFDNFSNSEALSQPVHTHAVVLHSQECTSDVSLIESGRMGLREIAITREIGCNDLSSRQNNATKHPLKDSGKIKITINCTKLPHR